ncbi:cytochrome b5-like, partial [Oppia nitens]|uniref:cytochrome b5-like n=1 Tax=Oppia nitens TaxID=1686743 RepID=UPI0023DA3698
LVLMMKTFTLDEVVNHETDNPGSVWLLIHDQVYDVSKFIQEHPGGEEVLLEQLGRDASEPFEDSGHTPEAREMMLKYKIGELCAEDRQKTAKIDEKNHYGGSTDAAGHQSGSGGDSSSGSSSSSISSSWLSLWYVPVVVGIAIIATIVYRFI